MYLRTVDGKWYVYRLHGAVFVSWVTAKDRHQATLFQLPNVNQWKTLLEAQTGLSLEAISPAAVLRE
jgi:hypothetical protein